MFSFGLSRLDGSEENTTRMADAVAMPKDILSVMGSSHLKRCAENVEEVEERCKDQEKSTECTGTRTRTSIRGVTGGRGGRT